MCYDVFDSESALELNPEIVTLTPAIFCICVCVFICLCVCVCMCEVQRFDECCYVQHQVVTLRTVLKMEAASIHETLERVSVMSPRIVIYVVFHFVLEKGHKHVNCINLACCKFH
jgi:hypothetical protein